MDRLGNVMGYRRAVSDSAVVLDATYEYDAFGREVRSTGPASDLMPYRFSTKYTDADSGLAYYGYRFYDPDRGRWINRDPIGEKGGLNLYGMVENSSINSIDYIGLINVGAIPGPNPTSIITDKSGVTRTRINSCNIVIFLGHNNSVPQGTIYNQPCSAGARYTCGPILGSTAPGIPQAYINGAPPPAGENTPQGGGELLTDSTAAIKNAKVMAQRFNYKFNSTCCREVRITVDCTGLKGAHQGFPSGLLRGVCNTDITVDFNKPNLDWVSK